MIKVTKDTTVIAGELNEILSEITLVLAKVYQSMVDNIGEEEANEHLVEIGKLAIMSDEEVKEYARQKMEEK